jgi:acyl-CoA dehydrogenase
VVDLTLKYTRERQAFGRPIFGFQNTKFTLADAATEVAVSKAFLDQCIDRHLTGQLDVPGAAMAKMWTTERLGKVADSCLQLFGGYGFMTEYPIAKAWTGARVQRIFGGTTEIMKEIIARSL